MKKPRSNQEWFWGVGLFLLTCLAYLPVLHGGFVWDDGVMVTDNLLLRTAQGLHDIWFTTRAVDPLPVTMTALWLQWHLWGANPLGFHFVDVVMHALGALLLWRVLLRFTPHPKLAWLAAGVFGLHPVCVASAGWISEQKNTLSGIFYFASILCYLRLNEAKKIFFYWLALFFFLLALLSKGSTVMLPVILLLIIWWQTGRVTKKDLARIAPFFALSVLAGLGTIWIQNHKAIGGAMAQDVNGISRIAAASEAAWFYIWKDVIPARLSVIYPQWHIVWWPMAALAATFAVGWWFRKNWGRHVLLGLGCFVVTLFPVMGFFDMYFLLYSRVADHWQYLALPALAGLVICGGGYGVLRHLPKIAGACLAVALLGLLFVATWIRAAVYQNEKSIWSDTVAKNPEAWMAWNNLGNAFAAEGETARAIGAYENALTLHPVFADAESNLGNALVTKGQWSDAVYHLQRAVEEEPRMAKFHFNYGVGLAGAGRTEQAAAEYQAALNLQANNAEAHNNLSHVYYQRKQYVEALQEAEQATQLNPHLAEPYLNAAKALAALQRTPLAAHNFEIYLAKRPSDAGAYFEYGTMLAMAGNLEQALPQFQAVVRFKPNEAAGHCNLGNTFAALKQIENAVAEFRAAVRLQPDDAQNQGNLANALFEKGNVDEAIEHYTTAVKLNPGDPGARVNFAYALQHGGRKAEAIAEYREALRLRPGDAAIEQRLKAMTAP